MVSERRLSKILLTVVKSGIFFILFLPLVINSEYFFPFIVPKNVLFRMAVEVIFFSWLALMSINPLYRLNWKHIDKLTWAVALFFVINLVATVLGLGIHSSFWGNYERMAGLFHLAHLLMFFFVLIGVLKEKKEWHSFLTFSLFASVLMTFLGIAQWLHVPFLLQSSGGERISGTVGNATFLAAYLIFHLFILLYFLGKERRFDIRTFALSFAVFDVAAVLASIFFAITPTTSWGLLNVLRVPLLNEAVKFPQIFLPFLAFQIWVFTAWWYRERKFIITSLLGVVFIFESFILYHTQTRGAIIGFVAGLALVGFFSLFSPSVDKRIKTAAAVGLALLAIAPFALVGAKDTAFVQHNSTLNRLATISLTDTTTESRLVTWKASWNGWTEDPKIFFIGVGPEHYYYVFNKHFPVEIYKDAGSQIWFDRAHNIIFDIGVTTGVVGLAAYLSILALGVWMLFRIYQQSRALSNSIVFIGLLGAYVIQNLFVFDTLNSEILLYLVLGFIVFLSATHRDRTLEEQSVELKQPNYVYLGGLTVVLLLAIFAINVRTLQANDLIFRAVTFGSSVQYNQEKTALFKASINRSLVGRFEARQQLGDYAVTVARNTDEITPQLREFFEYSVAELEKSVVEEPKNIRHMLWLSSLYNALARFDQSAPQKGLRLLLDNIELSKTRPQVYFEIGQAYAFSGDFIKAVEYFEIAVAQSPTVIDSHINLLTMLIISGNLDRADQQLATMVDELGWKPRLEDYDRIVDAYTRVDNWAKAAEMQELAVVDYPTADQYAQLAAIYAKFGQNDQARAATQRAVELNPQFAKEAEIFIKELEAGNLLDDSQQP